MRIWLNDSEPIPARFAIRLMDYTTALDLIKSTKYIEELAIDITLVDVITVDEFFKQLIHLAESGSAICEEVYIAVASTAEERKRYEAKSGYIVHCGKSFSSAKADGATSLIDKMVAEMVDRQREIAAWYAEYKTINLPAKSSKKLKKFFNIAVKSVLEELAIIHGVKTISEPKARADSTKQAD